MKTEKCYGNRHENNRFAECVSVTSEKSAPMVVFVGCNYGSVIRSTYQRRAVFDRYILSHTFVPSLSNDSLRPTAVIFFSSPFFPHSSFSPTYYTSNWFSFCVCVSVLPDVCPPTDGDQVSPEKGNFFNFYVFHARLSAQSILFFINVHVGMLTCLFFFRMTFNPRPYRGFNYSFEKYHECIHRDR